MIDGDAYSGRATGEQREDVGKLNGINAPDEKLKRPFASHRHVGPQHSSERPFPNLSFPPFPPFFPTPFQHKNVQNSCRD